LRGKASPQRTQRTQRRQEAVGRKQRGEVYPQVEGPKKKCQRKMPGSFSEISVSSVVKLLL
jgi:hypothetical protein